jgi:hypothetical protein
MLKRGVPKVSRLVVGNGPSANALLRNQRELARPRRHEDDVGTVHLTSQTSMWERMPPELPMGQTPNVLVEKPYQVGHETNKFMKVKDFTKYQAERYDDSMKEISGVSLPGNVLSIVKNGRHDFLVTYLDFGLGTIRELRAANIFYAGGPSAEKSILGDVDVVRRPSRRQRAFKEYCSGTSILTGQTLIDKGGAIAVVGDGPTALWTAAYLADLGNEIYVVGPDNGKAFANANPGGRNSDIIRTLGDRFYVGSIEGVEEREVSSFQDWSEFGTSLHIRNLRPFLSQGKSRAAQLPVTSIVSAIGPVNGFSSIIDPSLIASLRVVEGCLALASPDEDFYMFGSQAYYGSRLTGAHSSFDELGALIRQPPVGIASIELASRQLLRQSNDRWDYLQFIAMKDLHPATASGIEIKAALQGEGVDPRGAEEMAQQILKKRSEVATTREYGDQDMSQDLQTVMSGKSLVNK